MSCLQVLDIMHDDDDDILEVPPPPSSPQLSYNEVKWFALMPNRRKCEMLLVRGAGPRLRPENSGADLIRSLR